MLRCTMCGHMERCCHVLCPVCGERMVRLEDGELEHVLIPRDDAGEGHLYPEDLNTQCKVCGQRRDLYVVTDYGVGDDLSLGICRECYFSEGP